MPRKTSANKRKAAANVELQKSGIPSKASGKKRKAAANVELENLTQPDKGLLQEDFSSGAVNTPFLVSCDGGKGCKAAQKLEECQQKHTADISELRSSLETAEKERALLFERQWRQREVSLSEDAEQHLQATENEYQKEKEELLYKHQISEKEREKEKSKFEEAEQAWEKEKAEMKLKFEEAEQAWEKEKEDMMMRQALSEGSWEKTEAELHRQYMNSVSEMRELIRKTERERDESVAVVRSLEQNNCEGEGRRKTREIDDLMKMVWHIQNLEEGLRQTVARVKRLEEDSDSCRYRLKVAEDRWESGRRRRNGRATPSPPPPPQPRRGSVGANRGGSSYRDVSGMK